MYLILNFETFLTDELMNRIDVLVMCNNYYMLHLTFYYFKS